MRKVCVVTGTRAEYGLLYPLIKKIEEDESLELQLIVTGMHLSVEFGLTYQVIEKEFFINKKIEILLSSDSDIGVAKSMGLAQISFSEAFSELKPDLVVLLGDRYEIFAAASTALICKLPIAHIHGGEITEGAFDDAIRHSISKMSHLHFTTTDEYKNRVIQLGEKPSTVFNVGSLGIENIKAISLLSKEEFEESIDFRLGEKNLLITFHPVTLENQTAQYQCNELLDALDSLDNTKLIFTKANSDTNGRIINKMIEDYVALNSEKAICFDSLGQLRYLSAMQYVDMVVGNSSSGIIEVPSFKIPTINIGDRQKGRLSAKSVLNCMPKKNDIINSIYKAYDKDFLLSLKNISNPYEKENTSNEIIRVLKDFSLDGIIKKSFYDLP